MLPTKFQVCWPFGSEEEAQNRVFKIVAILDLRLEWFKLYLIYKSPQCFLPSFKITGLSVQVEKWKKKKKKKKIFKVAPMAAILDFK